MKKKTIVITGGSNGIGKSISLLYLNDNYNVCVIDIVNELDKNNNIDYYYGDVSNEFQMRNIFKVIGNKYNNIDILINNAGKQEISSFEKMSISSFKSIVNNNLNGMFICTKLAYKYMKNGSKILNILSVHHFKPRINKYHYDVSKAGINMLTKELALELACKNITINSLSFGAVKTNMNKEWLDNSKEVDKVISKVPLKILFEADEIARFAKNILDLFASYTTGSDFIIDGGRSLV